MEMRKLNLFVLAAGLMVGAFVLFVAAPAGAQTDWDPDAPGVDGTDEPESEGDEGNVDVPYYYDLPTCSQNQVLVATGTVSENPYDGSSQQTLLESGSWQCSDIYGSWGDWSGCTTNVCGATGIQTRSRACLVDTLCLGVADEDIRSCTGTCCGCGCPGQGSCGGGGNGNH